MKEICLFPLMERGQVIRMKEKGSVTAFFAVTETFRGTCSVAYLQTGFFGESFSEVPLFGNAFLTAKRAVEVLVSLDTNEGVLGTAFAEMVGAIQQYNAYRWVNVETINRILPEDAALVQLKARRDTLRELRKAKRHSWTAVLFGKEEEDELRSAEETIDIQEKAVIKEFVQKMRSVLEQPLQRQWALEKFHLLEKHGLFLNLDDLLEDMRRCPREEVVEVVESIMYNKPLPAV